MEELLTLTRNLDYPVTVLLLIYVSYTIYKTYREECGELRKELMEVYREYSNYRTETTERLLEEIVSLTESLSKMEARLHDNIEIRKE